MVSSSPSSPRRLAVSLSTLALAAALVGGATAGCHKASGASSSAPPEDPPIHVTTVAAVEKPMPRYLALTGSLTPDRASDVAADSTGKLLETFVERGSLVAKDAMLARVDARSATLAAQEASGNAETARSQAQQAQEDCDRADKLMAEQVITRADYDRQKSQCTQALSTAKTAAVRVATAYKGVGDTNIKAPFAGMIAERYVSIGEYVRPDTKIARVVSIDPLRLELTVPEAAVAEVTQGLGVNFSVVSLPDQSFKGSVRYIGPTLRTTSRDLLVEAVVPNPDQKLRPGMFATARVELGDKPAVTIPKNAVRNDGSLRRVFVVKEGAIEERLVKLGTEKGDDVSVDDGISAGDQVVSPLTNDVRDGLRVK